MGYIIIDTEGTGLFTHKGPDGMTLPSDAPGQPRMAEFAALVCDENMQPVAEFQSYIKPIGWDHDMPAEATAIHGLTMDFLLEHGRPVTESLNFYTEAIRAGNVLLGFNQQHDGRQVRAELRRAGMNDLFESTPNICVMRSITTNMKGQVKKLNGKGGFPRLIDAAAYFNIDYDESKRHTASEDCRVTAMIASYLLEAGMLLPAAVHYARNHPSRNGDEA